MAAKPRRTGMRAHAWVCAISVVLLAAGCATKTTTQKTQDAETTSLTGKAATLQTSRIENWSAPNSRTLLVEATDGSRYRAQFLTDCIGLPFVTSIGFETRGLNQLDQYSDI